MDTLSVTTLDAASLTTREINTALRALPDGAAGTGAAPADLH